MQSSWLQDLKRNVIFFEHNHKSYIHLQQTSQGKRLVFSYCLAYQPFNLLPVAWPQELVPQASNDWHSLFEVHDFLLQSWHNLIVR